MRYDTSGPVAQITLDRPDKLNAMTLAMYDELGEAYCTARDDTSVRAIVLTGAGDRAGPERLRVLLRLRSACLRPCWPGLAACVCDQGTAHCPVLFSNGFATVAME